MKIIRVKLSALREDSGNVRVHGDANMRAIRGSLESHGQVEPLVVRKTGMTVIGGNGRLKAMRDLGWKECDIVILDISESKAAALSIAMNKTGDLSEFDFSKLADMLMTLDTGEFDMTKMTGFCEDELKKIAEWTPANAPISEDDSALASFIEQRKLSREKGAYKGEVNFWVCLVFQSWDEKQAFLKKVPDAKTLYGMYADGRTFAAACGIDLPTSKKPVKLIEPRIEEKLARRVLR